MGPLSGGSADDGAVCAEHQGEPATGQCVTCKKKVCEACGGVVSNRGVYCIDHTPAVTTASSASPGMNPLLAGGAGADAAVAGGARARASMDKGVMALVAGIVLLIVFFGIAFGMPGELRSKELPAQPPSAAAGPGGYGTGGAGGPGGYPGMGGPGGYPGPGGPGGYPGGYPGGPPGAPPMGSDSPYPGSGAPPGGPMSPMTPAGSGR